MKLIFFILLFSGFFIKSSFAQPCLIKLSGHVEDMDTRDKLSGATVIIEELNKIITTDEKGDFTFFNLCAGSYTLKVTHVDCSPIERKLELVKSVHLDINMPHYRNTNLEEITVTGIKADDNTGFKQELKGKEMEQTRGLSLAEALSQINGVNLLQTGSTIAKPVIHGLHSNRILTINNGVRQEGQQWGNDHAPEVDPFIADRLVVIKGVDELRYGSDAIGGVVLVNPRPIRSLPGSYGELNTAYFTNNRQYVASAMIEQRFDKRPEWSYRLQGSFKRAANITAPDYRQNNTGVQEENFSATVGWRKNSHHIEAYYSQFHTKLGIFKGAEVGGIADLQDRINQDRPATIFTGENTYSIERPYQEVTHRLFKLKSDIESKVGKFNIQLAAQMNNRLEYDVIRNQAMNGAQMDLDILTLSEDISWEHPKVGHLEGSAGISLMQQDNSYSGRYLVPNYFLNAVGGYWLEKWSSHQWEIQGGIRYDYKDLSTERIPSGRPRINKDFNFSTLASSFNTIFKINPDFTLNAGLSLASRSPQVNELLSNGIHQGIAAFEQGIINSNTNDTVPAIEQSLNFSFSLSFTNKSKTLYAQLDLYHNNIQNFVYGQPMPEQPVQTIGGAYRLIQYRQVDARLQGADISLRYQPVKQLELSSRASLLRARNRDINDWLLLMPADRIVNSITYHLKNKGKVSETYITVEMPLVFEQTRVPDENKHGLQDYKAPPDGYSLLNMHLSTVLKISTTPLTIILSGNNILNHSYRNYLNSFRYFTDEIGRNISLRVKLPLENIFKHS